MEPDGKPDLAAVLEYYAGIEGRDLDLTHVSEYGNRSIRCPFHDDHVASASINLGTGRFRCFACDAPSGDSYDIIMEREGIGFKDAKRWAAEHIGYEDAEVCRAPAPRRYRPSFAASDDD